MVSNDKLPVCVGPATIVPFFLMVMNSGAVPPEPVTVIVLVEPGHNVAGGVMVQVGIGVPATLVDLVQLQVVAAVLPADESVMVAV